MIRNSEEANKYYQLLNEYIDDYIEKWKIKPNNLKSYLIGNKSKMVNFLERKGLRDIQNIEVVIKDIIEDRVSMEKDSIMTFESFTFLNSDSFRNVSIKESIYRGLSNATIEHEKLLADIFDVSLSVIDLISPERHIFKINDDYEKYVIVFTSDELIIVKENIIDFITEHILSLQTKFDFGGIALNLNNSEIMKDTDLHHKLSQNLNLNFVEILNHILATSNSQYSEHYIGIIDGGEYNM